MKKQTLSEIMITYKPKELHGPIILCSIDAYVIFRNTFSLQTIALQEQVIALYLNRANKVIGYYKVSSGGITGSIADIRLILSVALKAGATGIMLAHNHPSGSIRPSKCDDDLTLRLREAAKIMDINLLDHMIISPEEGKYFSFADEGLL